MVLEKVKAILSEQFDVEEDSITPETNIADDLGADSLEYLDLDMLTSSVYDENGNGPKGFCTACFDGNYPMDLKKCKRKGC